MPQKRVILGLTIFILSMFSVYGQYQDCGAVPSSVLEGRTCQPVTACSSISGSNTYYLLTSDLTSDQNCITFSGTNNILDLNEHTITFGNAAGTLQSGIFLSSSTDCKLTNGYVRQGSGNGVRATVIRSDYSNLNNMEISFLNISYYGDDSAGMMGNADDNCMRMISPRIHDNYFDMRVQTIANRHRLHSAICVDALNGQGGEFYRNTVRGTGHGGIGINPQGGYPNPIPVQVYENDIRYEGVAANPIALGVGGETSDPELRPRGLVIRDNYINMIKGKGIYVAGVNGGRYGPADGLVYNNYVETTDDLYISGEGTANFALRIRYGALNITFFNNTFISKRLDYNDFSPLTVSISEGPPYGGYLNFFNNTIICRDSVANPQFGGYPRAVWLTGSEYNPNGDSHILFENNHIISDRYIVSIGGMDNYLNYTTFVNNTFSVGPNALEEYGKFLLAFGGTYAGASWNNTFVNNIYEGWLDPDDISWPGTFPGGSYYFKWTLNVKVQDAGGNPIPGALVTLRNANNQVVHSNIQTPASGIQRFNLTSHQYLESTQKVVFNPYTVTVNYNGEEQTRQVTLSAPTTETFIFDSSGIVMSDLLCNAGNGLVDCATLAYGDSLHEVRVDCTDDGSISSSTFSLTYIDNAQTYFSGSSTQTNQNTYIYQTDTDIADSGDFELAASCTDNEGNQATMRTEWTVPYGTLSVSQIAPTSALSLSNGSSFTYTTLLTCSGGECGTVSATLDPIISEGMQTYCSPVELPQYSSAKAVDGIVGVGPDNYESRWSSVGHSNWWYVDLGSSQTINNVEILWESYYPPKSWATSHADDYYLQVSEDASTWTDVLHITDGDGGLDNLTFNPVSARYVKFQGVHCAFTDPDYPVYSFWEFKVYSSDGSIVQGSKGVVSPQVGASPFYTTSQNPVQCANMVPGSTCTNTWNVVANGDPAIYTFFVDYESDIASVEGIESSHLTINITGTEANVTQCSIPFDQEPCGCITLGEIAATISAWYSDILNLSELINTLRVWKQGC